MNHHVDDHTCLMNEDAVALALQVLEPDEENDVRTHLPHCRSCREIVRSTELVMRGIGAAVPQIDPPDRLRSRIMAQLDGTPQETPRSVGTARRPAHRSIEREASSRPPGRDDGRRGGGPAIPAAGHRRRRFGGRRMAAAVVAVVVVLGIGGSTAYTLQVHQQRDSQIVQTQALADLITQLEQPGMTHATLAAAGGQPVAAVVAGPSGPTVVTAGLPDNRVDTTTYVLWGINAAGPHPLGAFDVAAGTATHPIAAPVGAYNAYAISLEPGRALPATPTTVVASGPVVT